ncbi:hypothetical protein [Aquipuribacter nitratireducens]|uniref:Outer membrane lipoprotein carrier protein LolA n=1 Tax=Aquipuribacter nitratireducens TaxID=650104 RepID=A0ABW0GNC0_9MICO
MSAASRWLVPAAVAALVVGGGVTATASSDGVPDLPERSAAELLVAVHEAEPTPFSGTVRTVAALGLPDLAGLAGASGRPDGGSTADPTSVLTRLLSGENELRVWVGGPEQQRVSLVDDFSELDVVRDGDVVWSYSSTEDTLTRLDLAEAEDRAEAAAAEREASLTDAERAARDEAVAELEARRAEAEAANPYAGLTPDEAARQLLADAEDTDVSVGAARVVAGRDAYTLVATPQDDDTLVGGVEVSVDAETGLVLQVSVVARGAAEPAWVSGFTALDLGAPDPSVFAVEPAPGTTVVDALEAADEKAAEEAAGSGGAAPGDEAAPGAGDATERARPEPVVHGEGWSTVVEVELPRPGDAAGDVAEAPSAGTGEDPQALLEQLTTPVEGGRVLTSALVSVLLTDDGRVLVGSVRPETLLSYAG